MRKSGIVYFISNCVFDLIAIKCGLGIFGIGLATALGTSMQLTYLLLYFRSKDRMLSFIKFDITMKEVKETLSLGTRIQSAVGRTAFANCVDLLCCEM